jgi:hypothetical protein
VGADGSVREGRRAGGGANFQPITFESTAPLPRGLAAPLSMKPPTDYIRHAARLARKLQMDASMGGTPQPDAEFYKALSKAFDEIAAGLELISKPD